MIDIASIQNPQFKTWQKILDARGIKKQGLALASGDKQVREFLSDFPEACRAVLVSSPDRAPGEGDPNRPVFRLRAEMFRELDLFGTGGPLLVLKVPRFPEWTGRDLPLGCTVLVPFQDPANVGAVIRTAAALGAAQVVLLQEAAHPFHPKSLRAAGPAVFRVPLVSGPSIAGLKEWSGPLFVLGKGGAPVPGFAFPERFGLVAGLEGPGLPPELESFPKLTIPMSGGVESLNAAMALGLGMYEWRRGRS